MAFSSGLRVPTMSNPAEEGGAAEKQNRKSEAAAETLRVTLLLLRSFHFFRWKEERRTREAPWRGNEEPWGPQRRTGTQTHRSPTAALFNRIHLADESDAEKRRFLDQNDIEMFEVQLRAAAEITEMLQNPLICSISVISAAVCKALRYFWLSKCQMNHKNQLLI